MSIELFEDQFAGEGHFDHDEILQPFTCMICIGIAINPCKCSKCETVYCRNCIPNHYWDKNINVRYPEKPYTCFKMCGSTTVVPLSKIERQILDSLSFTCQHEAEGCD